MSVPIAQLDGSIGLDVKVLMSPPIIDCIVFLYRCHGIDVEVSMSVPVAQLDSAVGFDVKMLMSLPIVDCVAFLD